MKDPKSVQSYRKEIDNIDDEILRLLNERARHVITIGKLKNAQDSHANLHTPAREAEILDRICKNNPGPFPSEALRIVYREIMSGPLALDGTMTVAYLARAAEIAAEDPSTAAIASELAGQLYGLKVLKARIEDNINNYTRFLVLSQKPAERTGKDKTSIMLSVKDKVGALYELLRPFASSGVNLTKIESRPSRRKAWEYIFFIDCEGHMDEDRIKKALTELKSRCLFLKILGSYPAHS